MNTNKFTKQQNNKRNARRRKRRATKQPQRRPQQEPVFTKQILSMQAATPSRYSLMTDKQKMAAINRRYSFLEEMSPCVKQYAKVLVNPFVIPREPACIPDLHSSPSTKFSAWSRGTFQNGTTGLGYIVFDPWQFVANDLIDTIDGVQNCAIYSTNNSFHRDQIITVTKPGDMQPEFTSYASNSPYKYDDFVGTDDEGTLISLSRYRVVGAGLRVKYVGPTLTNQGSLLAAREATNDNIPDRVSFSYLLGWQSTTNTAMKAFSNKWWACVYVPATPDDYTYDFLLNNYPGEIPTQTRLSHKCMIIAVNGADGANPVTLQFEAFAHYELIGKPQRTLSHTDLSGMSIVHNSAAQVNLNGDQAHNQSLFHSHLQDSGVKSPLTEPDIMHELDELMDLPKLFED